MTIETAKTEVIFNCEIDQVLKENNYRSLINSAAIR